MHCPVVVTRVAPLPTLNIVETNGVQTMSSLEMVDFINAYKAGTGWPKLRHADFLAKVPKVLGAEPSTKFFAHAPIAIGSGATPQSPVYNFPRREAILMAMSYSYKLQAMVYPFRVVWTHGKQQKRGQDD